jgi:type IV pilus assembly protein PilC
MTTTTFEYRVRDREGKLVKGRIEGDSRPVVVSHLRDMGFTPVEIKAASSIDLKRDITIPGISDRVPLKEISVMSRQLATMVAAGLTLARAIGVLSTQVESKPLRAALAEVRSEVEHGASFSSALAKHPKIFDRLYLAMVRAGEAGGQLDSVLLKLATSIEKRVALRSKVRSAFTYPAVVVCVVVLVVTAIMIFVVPTFKHLYDSLHGVLPLPTRIVIGASNVLASIWALAVVAAVVGLVVAFRWWISTERGRLTWDRLRLRAPIFGSLVLKMSLSRVLSTLSTLLAAGVGIMESLEMAADNVGNRIVGDAFRGAISGVRDGRGLAATLSDYAVIPPMVIQMIETGEESGAVSDMLEKVAEFYDNEIEATVSSLTSLLEPVLIVFMGACIGTIVVSLYLPMFDYVKLLTPS